MFVIFQLEELSEAEDALSEANILNNKDPEVWGYLSLLCLKSGRKIEAEQAYKYAIKVRIGKQMRKSIFIIATWYWNSWSKWSG